MKMKLVQAENYRLGLLKSMFPLLSRSPPEEKVIVAFNQAASLLKMCWLKTALGKLYLG